MNQQAMKRIFTVAFCVACLWALPATAQTLDTLDDVREITRQAMENVIAGDYGEVFAVMAPYWPLPENELAMLSMQTLTQRNLVGQRFGDTLGIALAGETMAGDSIFRRTYIEKLEVLIIRWVFTFYKPEDEWLVNAIFWDDDIDALL